MLSWTIQITIISLIFILLLHHLFQFFKNTLTVPKVKDLVNIPNKKYQTILNHISVDKNKPPIQEKNVLSTEMKETMKNELKNFLKSQTFPENSTGISSGSSIDFSIY